MVRAWGHRRQQHPHRWATWSHAYALAVPSSVPVHRRIGGPHQAPDQARHFGLVVDDKDAVRERLRELGCVTGRGLDFHDPEAASFRSSTTATSSSRRRRRSCGRRASTGSRSPSVR